MCKKVDTESVNNITENIKTEQFSKLPFIKFLNTIDNTGDLLKEKVDLVKQRRCIRAEMIAQKLDETRYIEFSKARCASFANKNRHKFSDWIGTNGE